ncbi:CDP-diacylglycerol--glycerol-3-phosphate 3-phosphatidyltransferase [Myxococcota bacterium]|nr:CDP-diacylglycerol--glycerol-3-phosphate 3-phosphatidyltransferase [Myxococcota bacterium]
MSTAIPPTKGDTSATSATASNPTPSDLAVVVGKVKKRWWTRARREKRERRKRKPLTPPTNFRRELYAIPNVLTYIRILMIPLVLFVLERDSRLYSFYAACIFAAACVTDFLDGYLARKLNQITILGKLIDPLADKLIVAATLIIMVPMGRVPSWVVIVLLSREFAITGLRGIAASEGLVIAASSLGKHKTAFQMLAIFGLLIHYTYRIDFLGLASIEVSFHQVGLVLLFLSLFFSLISAFDYFWKFALSINERYKEAMAFYESQHNKQP